MISLASLVLFVVVFAMAMHALVGRRSGGPMALALLSIFLAVPMVAHAAAVATSGSSPSLAWSFLALCLFGVAVAPTVTPGNLSSEFSLTKYAMTVGTVIAGIGVCLAAVQPLLPQGSKAYAMIGTAIAFGGLALKFLALFGYNSGRSDQKVAAIQAAGDAAGADDAAKAGTGADAGAQAAR